MRCFDHNCTNPLPPMATPSPPPPARRMTQLNSRQQITLLSEKSFCNYRVALIVIYAMGAVSLTGMLAVSGFRIYRNKRELNWNFGLQIVMLSIGVFVLIGGFLRSLICLSCTNWKMSGDLRPMLWYMMTLGVIMFVVAILSLSQVDRLIWRGITWWLAGFRVQSAEWIRDRLLWRGFTFSWIVLGPCTTFASQRATKVLMPEPPVSGDAISDL